MLKYSVKKILPLLALLVCFLVFGSTPAYASVTWTETQPGGDANLSWTPSAMSSDGQKIIVGEQTGSLYISSNKGSSWTLIDPTNGIEGSDWYTTSMSANGQIIIAGVYTGRLYKSTDGGSNWSETRPAGDADHNWYTTSMSSDGQIILAGIQGGSGRLYRSTNGGVDWSEIQPVGDADVSWMTSRISADGQVMLAGAIDRLYISTNGGSIWSEAQPAGNEDRTWISIGISANGQVILAGTQADLLFLSTDKGSTWSQANIPGAIDKYWYFNSVSSDGETLFAGGGDRIYISRDRGVSWSQTQPIGDVDKNWVLGNMSSDTRVMLAGVYNGKLYLGSYSPPSASSNNNSPSAPSPVTPSCSDTTPTRAPDLFQIDTAGTYANLYLSTVSGSSGYNIQFGTNSNANQYGDSFGYSGSLWTIGRTINNLSPNTTYYFKAQAVNGCTAGHWSKIVSVKTKSKAANITKWFANLYPFNSNPTLITAKAGVQATAQISKTPSSCSYLVRSGDSFWRIASQELGSGRRFGEIRSLNPGILRLRAGQTILLCK